MHRMSKLQVKNETVVQAPIGLVWSVITDIHQLHKVNPGVVQATGRMDEVGETRTCEIKNNGKIGTMTERLIELVPEKKTVWTIVSDSLGMSKMLTDTRFVFYLDRINDTTTHLSNETYYLPANLFARLMNELVIKRMIIKTQQQILNNIKSLTEK
jgi:carbon monoxide dehydrogenase subunit G